MDPENSPLVQALAPYNASDVLTGGVVTVRFAPAGTSIRLPGEDQAETLAWSADQRAVVQALLDWVSSVVALDFVEIDSGRPNIEFAQIASLDGTTGEGAEILGFQEVFGPGVSRIGVPTAEITRDRATLIHEIGHALALAHPFDGPSVLPDVTGPFDAGPLMLNTQFASRMAYESPVYPLAPDLEVTGQGYSMGALDIAALQLIYPAREKAAGDSVYALRAGELETIWDTGGSDTIDFSAVGTDAVIDLRAASLANELGGAGFLSHAGGDGGFVIAAGVEIEAARGGAGNDVLQGNAGDNALTSGAGNDTLDGGAGRDLAILAGNQSGYTLTLAEGGATLTDRQGSDGTDALTSIEALQFGDATVAPFDLASIDGAAALTAAEMESVIELYIAYFDRAPDAVGVNFWGSAFARGTTLPEMAALFVDQPETMAAYPAGLSNTDFATTVYDNVLGRAPDPDGFGFWVGVLDAGSVSRDQFILEVLRGVRAAPGQDDTPGEVAQRAADLQFLTDKTDLGAYFSITLGMSNVADARAALADFDGSASGLTAARNAIDAAFDQASASTGGDFLLPLVGVIDDPFAVA